MVAPPPRTSSTASTPRAATARRPHATDRGAWGPCTRTSAVKTENPMPDRRSSSSTSCSAALPWLVTSPIRKGKTGRGNRACRVSSPSPSRVRRRRSRSAARRPRVKAGSMSDIWSCNRPPRSYQVTRARIRTSVPSAMRTEPPASVSRALTRRRAVSNSTTARLAIGGRARSPSAAGSTRSNHTVPPRRPGLRLRMTPRTHTSSGNAVRTRSPMASPSSGTDHVGSPASSHSVGVPAAAGTPGGPGGRRAAAGGRTTSHTPSR